MCDRAVRNRERWLRGRCQNAWSDSSIGWSASDRDTMGCTRCGGPRGPIRGGGMDVAGKVALLTGGARIGQTVARALAQRGCGLALTYRSSRDAAEATAAAARAAGVRTAVLRVDVTDEVQVVAAVRQAEQELGRLDIL